MKTIWHLVLFDTHNPCSRSWGFSILEVLTKLDQETIAKQDR